MPKELLQFDYLELGPRYEGAKNILMLRYDHLYCKGFFEFSRTTDENSTPAMSDLCESFGVQNGLLSDGRTHFDNETERRLTKALKLLQYFSLT